MPCIRSSCYGNRSACSKARPYSTLCYISIFALQFCYVDWILCINCWKLKRYNFKCLNRLRTATLLDFDHSPHSANPPFESQGTCSIRRNSIPTRHGSHLVLVILAFFFWHRLSQPLKLIRRKFYHFQCSSISEFLLDVKMYAISENVMIWGGGDEKVADVVSKESKPLK
jgi:hypothetical protein